jgi:signal transduction histidine kinase
LSLEPRWIERETEFDVELEEIEYTGNESLMTHVWTNLIENAIKFGPQGGLVKISLVKTDEKILFTLEDEGPGIDENIKNHIFDKFYQADSSHKVEGNGLGLSLVKKIVSLADGEISIENRPEGGAKFTVKI